MPFIEEGNHDVYLIDYHLPRYNGLEILRKAIQLTHNSPLILLTGQNERKLENLAIDLGASDYLVKDEIIPALLERSIRYAIHRKQVEEQRLYEALYDSLTGLPNWNFFMKRLEVAIEKSKDDRSRQYAVLLMDLDRFKGVNNSLGHRIGDQLLLSVSKRLQCFLGPDMVLARFGGDEFTLLMDNILNPDEAQEMSAKILKHLSGSLILDNHEIFTSASIGIALSKSEYERPEDILRDADTAMCRAKIQGKSRCETFEDNMYNAAVEMFHLETDLRKAVENQEFILHYQPIISMETGNLHGFEALVRWEHPKQGLIPPTNSYHSLKKRAL